MATTKKTPTPRRSKAAPETPRAQRAGRRATKVAPADAAAHPPQPKSAVKTTSAPGGKLGVIVDMMRRPEGATVAQMSEATDWLPHSVRGALAGAVKKKHRLTVTSEKTDAGRIYRIAPLAAAPEPEPAAA